MEHDNNGTPWVNADRLNQSIEAHAEEHRGEDLYLGEVQAAHQAAMGNQELDEMGCVDFEMPGDNGGRPATLQFEGQLENGNWRYWVWVGKTPRTFVVTDSAEFCVVHYARQDGHCMEDPRRPTTSSRPATPIQYM